MYKEPPEKIAIYRKGTLVGETIGPIDEGSPLSLSCIVTGGRPQPTASWWSGRTIVERKSEVTREGHIRSELKIPEVSRAYHEKRFYCQAQNNNQQKPLKKEIAINMNLRPLSVRIKIPKDPLIAGQQYTFTCESQGSKPPAEITWFKEDQQVDRAMTRTRSSPGDITNGEVTVVPSQGDHNKILKCQASNPSMSASAISDTVMLSVHYAPIVQLKMGSNLVPSAIKQGDDVYFECGVEANPHPFKLTWNKNREEVKHNQTTGVILSGNSLVLQKVDRSNAGEYTCSATNTQGTQLSNPVRLDIMYPPECMVDHPTVLAVGRGERVNISCRVASNPPRATFNWRLNGSDKTYTSPGEQHPPWGHLASHYTFLGATDKDYGALFCWANNSIGIQEKPCVFQIIPAGPPSSPEHCEIINNTAENIEVMCEHGFDGGMAQMFLAEVYDEGGSLHLNQSSEEPQFSVESLQPGTTYTIKISAYNAKGRSQPISLTAVTLKVAEQRVGENKSLLYSPLIIIFLSILGVFIILILILVSVTRWRKNNLANNAASTLTTTTTSNPQSMEPLNTAEAPEVVPRMPKEEPDATKVKPKKKVVVLVENGMKDRLGAGDASSTDISSSKDALLGRHSESQPLANGSAGYYNSLGKTSFPSNYHPSTSSSSTLPRSHRAPSSSNASSSSGTLQHRAQYSPSASDDKLRSEAEDYFPSNTTRYSETLPRNMGRSGGLGGEGGSGGYRGGGILRVGSSDAYRRAMEGNENVLESESYRKKIHAGGDGYHGGDGSLLGETYHGGAGGSVGGMYRDVYHDTTNQDTYQGMVGDGGGGGDMTYLPRGMTVEGDIYRGGNELLTMAGGSRSGKDRYRLLEELKNNPKYVVRTRTCDPNDESFV